MIRVTAPSRLHFGLLSFPAAERWHDSSGHETLLARRFGGAGLMIESPGVVVAVEPSAEWSAKGPLAARALEYARNFDSGIRPQRLAIERCAPEHAGLGTGTQLALAIGGALAAVAGSPMQAAEIARRLGRGQRSALGIHGFGQGGFVVDGGKGAHDEIAPLVARAAFPEEWRVVLIVPTMRSGAHGLQEAEAFKKLQGTRPNLGRTETLCRLVLLGMLPSLAERDFQSFSQALHAFNRLAGETFVPVQGGVYAGPEIAESIEFIRELGFAGAGQSSWGQTVFAVAENRDRAEYLADRLRQRVARGVADVLVTSAANHGAALAGATPVR
jgi:beta-ribofuranosylaminobenzene 5'-phosphate synthase